MTLHLQLLVAFSLAFLLWPSLRAADFPQKPAKIPVILDTDIGDDIDDTWALALILKSPELDLKLVVGDYYKANYRAKLIAKFLQTANRSDVAVGVGLKPEDTATAGQAKWVENYNLKSYPGKVHPDGVQALIDTIMASPTPITLISIGPAPNVAEALRRQPEIANKARFVGMYGSVRKGYDGNAKPAPEWNVKADPKACQKVFTAAWDMTITPLDTCGLVRLRSAKFKTLRDSTDPIAKAVIENYDLWAKGKPNESSILFDTVAVYLAFSTDLANMEKLSIRVADDGMTLIDPQGKPMNVAASWKDLAAFEDLLVKRLTTAVAAENSRP
ncbi:MAG: nucleoside hydrolase [Planctomycetota bacterium]|nr:nucleoside hydrolase [Planctomycetota bacterium]